MRRREPWEPNPDTILEDLIAWANNTRTSTGPRTFAEVEAAVAGKRRAARARRDVAQAKRIAVMELAELERKARGTMQARILRAMEPGLWYGAYDVLRAVDAPKGSHVWFSREARSGGLVGRQRNPAWSAKPVQPWRILSGEIREPKWLYRLTAAGEAKRTTLAKAA